MERSIDKRSVLLTKARRQLIEVFLSDGGRESAGPDRRPTLVYAETNEGGLAAVGIHHLTECVVRTITGELLPLTSGPGSEFVVE